MWSAESRTPVDGETALSWWTCGAVGAALWAVIALRARAACQEQALCLPKHLGDSLLRCSRGGICESVVAANRIHCERGLSDPSDVSL